MVFSIKTVFKVSPRKIYPFTIICTADILVHKIGVYSKQDVTDFISVIRKHTICMC